MDAQNAIVMPEKRIPCCSTAEQKEYVIEADCMYDRERFEWVPTRWQCGCCHAEVQRTDTECWHCRSKLRRGN